MRLDLFPILQYIAYFLKKEDRHALQSPFAFQVYQGLKDYKVQQSNRSSAVESLRQRLLHDHNFITINDLGAGSRRFSSRERKISDIARYSCSSKKFSLLYQYFCSLTPAQTVIELGTCLGINSCYLAAATRGKLYTFEGAEELVRLAEKHISGSEEIHLIAGDISETLPIFLRDQRSVDFAFIDANHTYEDTLSYFNQLSERIRTSSIVIIGDIHWSKGMNKAWREISGMEQVRLSLDFFECGVLLFKEGLDKQHYILGY